MIRNLKWLGATFEAFLGIPILGGAFIMGMGYSPLGFMFVYHAVVLVLSITQDKRIAGGPIMGIVAATLGFIPIVGMVLHWVAAIALGVDALTTRRKRSYSRR